MTRTVQVLEAGRVLHGYHDEDAHAGGYVDDGLGEVECAFERFLLALPEAKFRALVEELKAEPA